MIFLFYFLALMTLLTFGAGYCASVVLDFADLIYYIDAAKLKFTDETLFFMIIHLIDFGSQLSADGYSCVVKALDGIWWVSADTGIKYYMDDRHSFSFDVWEDIMYSISALIHLI